MTTLEPREKFFAKKSETESLEATKSRVSKRQLAAIIGKLSEKELQILQFLERAKLANSDQIKRLFFAKSKSELAGLRATNRTMKHLEALKTVAKLTRRIGGRSDKKPGGSSSSIYQLANTGLEILRFGYPDKFAKKRRRIYEPNLLFLEHTLAITEAFTRLKELEFREKAKQKIEILTADFEPKAWRNFSGGNVEILKPDLFAKIATQEFEDNYFFEIDRATESLNRIFAKCQTYVAYFNSGVEQRLNGVFPFVVWLVPDERRRNQIENLFCDKLKNAALLFQVIVFSELEILIAGDESEKEETLND